MTTENETVTLSAEVAKALEEALVARNGNKEILLKAHALPYPWEDSYLNDIDLLTLASALINGYQIEKSPEGKLQEYYTALLSRTTISHNQECLNAREADGIRLALGILGIKIKGINA